ncbi:MAG: phosphatase PAP2 family protein [Candidatus Babeliales bacterium]|nr:phosphatase PAP2 family protein [Candidatus Babeliales bacterium]
MEILALVAATKKKLHRFLCILLLQATIVGAYELPTVGDQHAVFTTKKNSRTKPTAFFVDVLHDIGSMYRNLIDWDSYKTVVATFPLYAASSLIDRPIHEQFYDDHLHKNIKQMPSGLVFFAEHVAIPLEATAASAIFLFASDKRLRETSKMFIVGLPFVVWTADLIKVAFKSNCCFRPLHERFSKNHKRCYGGFPSAHAAQVTFAAALFGLQYGAPAIVPLSIIGALVVSAFINDNRHYVSQIVAGGGLGVLYALAASKVVDKKIDSSFNVSVSSTINGSPALQLAYNF